jgi:hypothetical protein
MADAAEIIIASPADGTPEKQVVSGRLSEQ